MLLVKCFRIVIACLIMLLLNGCMNTAPYIDVERHEAMKARVNLALAYLEQGDFAKARENIDKALTHDSQDYLPYSLEAYYFQQLNNVKNAEQSYQRAIQLSRKLSLSQQPQPDVLNNYGTFLCAQRQFDAAYMQFEQALSYRQSYYHQADTLENIALCAKQEQQRAKMENALQQLATLDPVRAARFQRQFE